MAAIFPRVYILELNRNMIPEFSWWFLFGGCNGICWSIASIVFCLLYYLKKRQRPLKIDECHECIRDTADPVNKANIPRFFYLFLHNKLCVSSDCFGFLLHHQVLFQNYSRFLKSIRTIYFQIILQNIFCPYPFWANWIHWNRIRK